MSAETTAGEGYIPFRGYRTWYRIVGEAESPGKYPLLILHGGPGASHDYLEPIGAIAATGRRVIFYDQLGGGPIGSSQQSRDVDTRVVRRRSCRHAQCTWPRSGAYPGTVMGWYAWHAICPDSTGGASQPRCCQFAGQLCHSFWEGVNQLRTLLPPEVQQTLLRHEAAGTLLLPSTRKRCWCSIVAISVVLIPGPLVCSGRSIRWASIPKCTTR